MSIEMRLEELTKAINELTRATLGASTSASSVTTTSTPDTPSVSSDKTKGGNDDDDDSGTSGTSAGETAGRRTYVFDKTTKTGQIVEKGGEVPTGDNFVRMGKTKWEGICTKYELDPTTGAKVEAPADESIDDLDDLDDLDDTGSDAGDDNMDLGLDDDEDEGQESTIDPADVKKHMIRLMKEVNREAAMKIFKKFGARNFDEIKPSDLQGVYDLADKTIKAGK